MVLRTGVAGRERELADVRRRLAAARAGDGGLLLVTGPPGIGKTALAQAAASLAAQDDLPVLTGRAVAEAAPPLWCRVPVLTGLGLQVEAATAAPAGTGEDARALRFMALQSLADQVVAALPQAGALVVLEDLHWADATSLALVARLPDVPLLVLATHRVLRPGGPAGEQSALAAELPWLQAEPAVTSVRLAPLDLPAVRQLLASLLDEPTGAELAEPVLARTRGNALFVRTVARLLAAVPAVRRAGGDVAGAGPAARTDRCGARRRRTPLVARRPVARGAADRGDLVATGRRCCGRRPGLVGRGRAAVMPAPLDEAQRLLAESAPAGGLSAREAEVVALVADGLTNRQIADRFVLSERTVESHVRNALLKLGLSRRAQLVAWRLSAAGR